MNTILFGEREIRPGKIICVGKNYAAHIEEMNSVPSAQMTVFMKPATSITEELVAERDEPVHFEGEICLLVKDGNVSGVGFGLDLTKRDLQSKLKEAGLPWERAKAFDGSALFSPFFCTFTFATFSRTLAIPLCPHIFQFAFAVPIVKTT